MNRSGPRVYPCASAARTSRSAFPTRPRLRRTAGRLTLPSLYVWDGTHAMPQLQARFEQAIAWYGARLPYHKGKWRVVEVLSRLAGLDAYYQGRSFAEERAGIRWRLHPECMVQRAVHLFGEWEGDDTREMLKLVRPGMVMFDVGAYFGYYGLLAALHGGPTARVVAFEPFAPNFAMLAANKALNGFANVELVNQAVADVPGELTFRTPPDSNRGSGGLELAANAGSGPRVAVTTLDAFVAANGIDRLDLIKMDVEGAEVRALAGARATLQRFSPVLMIELDPGKLAKLHTTPGTLYDTLIGLDYRCYRATPRGLTPFATPDSVTDFINLFCFPALAGL